MGARVSGISNRGYLRFREVRMAERQDLARIVGAENVLDEPDILEQHAGDMSFVNAIKPQCVVKPRSTDEVEEIVKWANNTLTPLVPVSSGPPHSRGDTAPTRERTVIVDLSGMKKILWKRP